MPFSATVNLGTVGVAITSVKLYGCTGTSGGSCTGCTALTGYENVSVSTFPLLVSGIPNGVTYIQAEALGACSADEVKQCLAISGIPGSTPLPTATMTPAPTNTPTPTATTLGPTSTPTPTPSISPTPSATPNCEFVVSADVTTPTPTPTETTPETTPETTEPAVSANCWTLTYDTIPGLPSDLYVRYRDTTGEVVTVLINGGTVSQENGDSTSTSAICVNTAGAYNTPIFVQGGVEISYSISWVEGNPCEGPGTCFIS